MSLQAHNTSLHPNPCGGKKSCMGGMIGVLFYTSLALLALGCGGVRGALPAFGADQFDTSTPKGLKTQGSYFNWLLLSTTVGAAVGVIGFVWVGTNHGWWWCFLLATAGCVFGFSVFLLGNPFYRIQVPVPKDSPYLSIGRVIALAIRNRKVKLPENSEELYENDTNKSFTGKKLTRTKQFSWLDKAAIVPNGSKPSEICTVTQVEEVKILIRMLPIILNMFSLVGLLEFFYKEAPIGMRSLATSFAWISMSLGYFLSSVLVDSVNSVTRRVSPSKKGWITGLLLDDNNLNLFYWFLAVLSLINFAIYLLLASMYQYKKEDDGLLTTEMASTATSIATVSASGNVELNEDVKG
ncbi:hypothetical protein M8C21_015386 [Ambrosia artemisiifolia]|uniref:Uncharacterized protein n=1 Tax=Ambrosia artemisiifolia TaxID=4212 RepID=A0AAD5DCZ6_AMBAR|nr:hypothetical protein M8C21_015386 [Ambrosia artemisiifolia]